MSWTEALELCVAETRQLSRRRDLRDLDAADKRVSRHSCGAWCWDGVCTTCE